MLWPQNVLLIFCKSASLMKAPSLAGFRLTPPRFTSRVSSIGVMSRFPPFRRRSASILSPTSAPTAIMAVAILIPRAMARRATLLRRFWRRKDSKSSRKNISVRKYRGVGLQFSDIDHHQVTLLAGFQRNRVAAAALTNALRIDWSGAVLAHQTARSLIEAH